MTICVLLGFFNLFFNLSMEDEDAVYWSPSDWAWVGGLLDLLFPAWMAGRPIITSEARFRADWAFDFMARHKVTHTFLAPSAIRRLAQTPDPREDHDLSLRVICTGGEALAAEILEWSENALGVVCNEFYGLTEVNHLIGNCAALYPRRAGSMGRAYPGHTVLLVDDEGAPVAPGEVGEIAATKLEDRNLAAKSLVAALDERPDDRKLLMRLMQLYSEDKDWSKLIDIVVKLADFVDDPKQKGKYLQTAAMVSGREMGDFDQALEFYAQVRDLDPSNTKAIDESVEFQLPAAVR